MERLKRLTLQQSAGYCGKLPDTVAGWCRRYGIGCQLHPRSPWLVDPLGLVICNERDGAALDIYQAGEFDHPAVKKYVSEASRLSVDRR